MGFLDLFKNKKNKENKDDKERFDYTKDIDIKEEYKYEDDYNELEKYVEEEVKVDNIESIEKEQDSIYDEVRIYSIEKVIKEEIIKVVDNYNSEKINDILKQAINNIGSENVGNIKRYLVEEIEQPDYIKNKFNNLNELQVAIENSILTIIYNFNENGIDELLKIATTNKNYKLKAINLLCKLASRSVDTEKVVDSIIFIMKSLDESEIQKVLVFLSQIKNNSKIARLLELYYKKYILDGNFELAYDTVINVINLKGKCSREQLIFLKALALHEGTLNIKLILNGQEGEADFKLVKNDLRVKAAVSFYALNKEDEEINYRLIYLKENSLQEDIRSFLSEVLI